MRSLFDAAGREFGMADYYSLLARAVSNLPRSSSATARRAIYDRANAALVNQLRSLKPHLPESDIAREKRYLDEAITRLEAEFNPQARANPSPAAPKTFPEKIIPGAGQARPATDSGGTSNPFSDLEALEAEMTRLLGREPSDAREKDKTTRGSSSTSDTVGENLRAFEEQIRKRASPEPAPNTDEKGKVNKQPPPGSAQPARTADEKDNAKDRENALLDDATIATLIKHYTTKLHADPRFVEIQKTIDRYRTISANVRKIAALALETKDSFADKQDPESRRLTALATDVAGNVDLKWLDRVDSDVSMRERHFSQYISERIRDALRRQHLQSDRDYLILAATNDLISQHTTLFASKVDEIYHRSEKLSFSFIELMLFSTSRYSEIVEALKQARRLTQNFNPQAETPAPENMISDDEPDEAISSAIESLKKRFGTEVVDALLRRQLGVTTPDVPSPAVADRPSFAPARRFPSEDEIEEMTAHAEAHQWKHRPIRRSHEPAARQFLRTTYSQWLEKGIVIPTHIIRKTDPDLHNALYTEIGAAGLREEGVVAAQSQEDMASLAEARPRRPDNVSPDEVLAAKTRRLQAALASDGPFQKPFTIPAMEDADEGTTRRPTQADITEIVEHGQKHRWKDRAVRRSTGPAGYAFFTETYAKWLALGIEIPPQVLKKADEDLYLKLYQEIGKDGMKTRLKQAAPAPQ